MGCLASFQFLQQLIQQFLQEQVVAKRLIAKLWVLKSKYIVKSEVAPIGQQVATKFRHVSSIVIVLKVVDKQMVETIIDLVLMGFVVKHIIILVCSKS